jgi:hypothetical protein
MIRVAPSIIGADLLHLVSKSEELRWVALIGYTLISSMGIDSIVSGTGILSQPDPAEAIREMKRLSAGGRLH